MLYKKSLYISFGLLLLCMAVGAWLFLHTTPEMKQKYTELMEMSDPEKLKKSQAPYTAKQAREGVEKDILITQNGERLKLKMSSDKAELVLEYKEESSQIVEKMHNVICLMQEELFYKLADGRIATKQPNGKLLVKHGKVEDQDSWVDLSLGAPMQLVRKLDAKQASYYYKNDLVLADDVALARYMLPGHQLPEKITAAPLMSGTAASVEFTLGKENINFKAKQLKATLHGASQ